MTLRRILFWIHLSAGVVAGIVIFTMSLTGVILAYERQITRWADHEFRIKPSPAQQIFTASEIIANIHDVEKKSPSGLTIRRASDSPAELAFGRDRVIFVNPYNNELIGESRKLPAFFSSVENVHRWLGVSDANRPTGRAVTGACNLAFFILVATGPFIWWPKEWGWANLKKIVTFRRGLGGRALYWNWHNVFGAWCLIPLFIIVLSGVVMSYPWANNLLYRMTGNEPPQPSAAVQRNSSPPQGDSKEEKKTELETLEELIAFAQSETPGWQSITVRLPSGRGTLTVTADAGDGGRPDLRSQFSIDGKTGEVRKETFDSYNSGRRLRTWARFSHTGEAGGIMGETIAAIAAAGASLLVLTGITLSIKRLIAWKARA
jgi:uncharacterized iron-regulated membrane protein